MTPAGATSSAPALVPALRIDDPVLHDFAADVGSDGPVVARGHGTRWELGGPVDGGAREATAPGGVVEYQPAEMTVRVRAGTAVADLEAALAERGQRSALPDRGGTVGGAVAVGESHLQRRGRGPVAASVLQVRYVSAEGRLITGGGPTVKNVTGYDLPRLLTGSLGTLGLLAEVTLRTNPIPATSRWLRADDVDPFAVDRLILRPGAILWDGATTWILLEGHGPDVEADQGSLARMASWREAEEPPPMPPHRWSLAPSELRRLPSGLRDPDPADGDPDPVGPSGPYLASIGVGTVWADDPAPVRTVTDGVAALTRRLKDNFDPTGRLAPGRSLGRP